MKGINVTALRKAYKELEKLDTPKIKWAWFSSLGKTVQDRLDIGAKMPPGMDNPRCERCGLCSSTYFPFTFPNLKGSTVFVVTSPTEEEAYEGEVGGEKAGRERTVLRKYVAEPLGLRPQDYSIVPSVLCKPPPRKKVLKSNTDMCSPFVFAMLDKLKGKKKAKPLRIIAMGKEAAAQVFQTPVTLKDHIGETRETPAGETTVTYSPGMVLVPDLKDGGYKIGVLDVIRRHVARFVNREPNQKFPKMKVLV